MHNLMTFLSAKEEEVGERWVIRHPSVNRIGEDAAADDRCLSIHANSKLTSREEEEEEDRVVVSATLILVSFRVLSN